LEFVFLFLLLPNENDGIRLFARGATEFIVVVAALFAKLDTEFKAPIVADGTVSVAKSETEFKAPIVADGTVSVANSETEFRTLGTVLVAKFDSDFIAELFFLIRLDTVFILELSMYS
jgi:hypothetical protein